MINISRNNYEKYFLDFQDGKLSPSDEEMLMLFLNENPDLKTELEFLENDSVNAEIFLFENKRGLKKTGILSGLTIDNFDELCIARLEGDLNDKEIAEFNKLIKENTKKQREYRIYELSKTQGDYAVIYKDKAGLKKQGRDLFLKRNYTIISVAASVVILIALYLLLPGETEKVKTNELFVEKIENSEKAKNITVLNDNSKSENLQNKNNIKHSKIESSDNTTKQEVEDNILEEAKEEFVIKENNHLANILTIDIMINSDSRFKIEDLKPVSIEEIVASDNNKEKYISVKTFLAASFNKRVLKKENKNTIEFFDLAQAGIEGINRLTGSKMSLKRKYDKNGIPDKTEFNSRLIAFSTPIKKD